ncbi:MAG: fructose-bisphosphatase class III [Proteobacteria bacterium]|nr:fructose-bisphosphatase class III [Pseudomonadota bacterium]
MARSTPMIDPHLQILAKRYPTITAALVELGQLGALLGLPAPTVHVVSDVHGEYVKLRQVINNASGSLRPLIDRLFPDEPAAERTDFLAHLYYPRETWLARADRSRARLVWFATHALVVIRELARRSTIKHVERIVPDPYDPILRELLFGAALARPADFAWRLVEPWHAHDRTDELVRMLAHVVRNLAVGELVVAGDLGDRGPRIDKVIDVVMQQPNVAITWGNHDASWMAACLGHGPSIATVVRIAIRYQRRAQLEEGYGISLAPLEHLARTVYGDDPCDRFQCYGEPPADVALLQRMQKAIAIIQFKLEAQVFRAHPEWAIEDRALVHALDLGARTVTIDGVAHPLLDARLPTLDPAAPDRLTDAELRCLRELTHGFVESSILWKQMSYVAQRGTMYVVRDRCVIFHACIPVDERGEPCAFPIDGVPRRGKALLDAIDPVVYRAFQRRAPADLDLLYYLWTGPLSPCFGKSKMATFETYFVGDKAVAVEHKNPYFELLHDAAFCARILGEFGVDPAEGFIINGHVPVKLEAGELPVKRSGRAITIDGAFAAAYGDKGFSLVLASERIYLAQHHHFESLEAAVAVGADIVPTVADVQRHAVPRTIGDTEVGAQVRAEIEALEALVRAYASHALRELAT